MTMELDPVFIRALRLLHSTSKESGMQLKAMLDESIRMKENPSPAPSKMAGSATQQSKDHHSKESTDRYCKHNLIASEYAEFYFPQFASKFLSLYMSFYRRNLDKLKRDLSELVPDSKKPRLHSPARSSPGITAR